MLPFINFRGVIINLSHFTYALIENRVMEKKDTCWNLRVHVDRGEGFDISYDTQNEAQEAYDELCNILMQAHKTEAIR